VARKLMYIGLETADSLTYLGLMLPGKTWTRSPFTLAYKAAKQAKQTNQTKRGKR
jgi:hypothetical protein